MQQGDLTSRLLTQLQLHHGVQRYWVAFSGGIDSQVLLHVLAQRRYQLESAVDVHAVYVNHSLNPLSDDWALHCQQICEKFKIPFQCIDVNATPLPGESPEAKARQVRYDALMAVVREGDCLLTAHHQDDQLETLLLQLMRGSGPKGLAAMPMMAKFGEGCHLRPLLTSSRKEIHAYALRHKLKWIEDDSNQNVKFDRNFLRHEIIPTLKQRWPSLLRTANRTATLCAEASMLLENEAQRNLIGLITQAPNGLDITGLRRLSAAQRRNVLRSWIHSRGFLLPSQAQLNSVIVNVIDAASDAMPMVRWQSCEIRRYRHTLYIMPPLSTHNSRLVLNWSTHSVLTIDGVGEISSRSASANGIATKYITADNATIRFRQGGEKIKPLGCHHHRPLKKLLQELGVPPWVRERIPLLYINGNLAAVGQFFIDEAFKTSAGEAGITINWQPVEHLAIARG
ncbi:MAG: tRNA lysidine(34) synthetase TilS [Gammaproteobacteria bacterium]|nr:tRNA lysidine(34) synthetase TilS [Gammaproteobacteria bacterium]